MPQYKVKVPEIHYAEYVVSSDNELTAEQAVEMVIEGNNMFNVDNLYTKFERLYDELPALVSSSNNDDEIEVPIRGE